MNTHFIDCVVAMADYIHETFDSFPTVPPIFALMYLQAHQLDTEFYDYHFAPALTCALRQGTIGSGADVCQEPVGLCEKRRRAPRDLSAGRTVIDGLPLLW
jgi:hypothetical protein